MTETAAPRPEDRLRRYGGAAIGPVAAAATQFFLSLVLLSTLTVADFGRFSFLLVASQFSIGLWSALFAAPLLVAAAGGAEGGAISPAVRAIAATSCLALVPAGIALAGLALAVGADVPTASVFGVYGAAVLLRQFARAWAMAHGAPAAAMRSDLIYSAALAIGVALILAAGKASLPTAAMALLAAILTGLQPFLAGALKAMFTAIRASDVRGYAPVWRRDSRWSLLGVLSTEGTVNSHSYLVTAALGAAAFAPIAATALLIRPITVAINALVEFERARFARDVANGQIERVAKARQHLQRILLTIWGASLIAAALVLTFAADLVFGNRYDPQTLFLGTGLWFGVALMRALHAPEGAVLQGAGRFRELASISIATALVSLAGVTLGLVLGGALWSIAGVIAGEGLYALILRVRARSFLEEQSAPGTRKALPGLSPDGRHDKPRGLSSARPRRG